MKTEVKRETTGCSRYTYAAVTHILMDDHTLRVDSVQVRAMMAYKDKCGYLTYRCCKMDGSWISPRRGAPHGKRHRVFLTRGSGFVREKSRSLASPMAAFGSISSTWRFTRLELVSSSIALSGKVGLRGGSMSGLHCAMCLGCHARISVPPGAALLAGTPKGTSEQR